MRFKSRRLFSLLLILALFLSVAPSASAVSFNVTVEAGPHGSVIPAQSGLRIEEGQTVHVAASPDSGYRFDHWEVNDSGKRDCEKQTWEYAVTGDVTLKAYFVEDVYTVTVRWEDHAGGEINLPGLSGQFAPGSKVTLTLTPYDGLTFSKWSSGDVTLENASSLTTSFIMPEKDVTVYASSELNTYHFTVSAAGGRVVVQGKEPDANGQYTCKYGEEIEVEAVPAGEYLFSSWIGTNDVDITAPESESTTVICPASDFSLRAQFASSLKTLTITSTEGGTVSPQEGELRMGVDTYMELLAVPEEGYAFSRWECSVGEGFFNDPKNPSSLFTMPDSNCTITAVFIKGGYRLTLLPTVGGRVNEDVIGNYEMGEQISVIATPEEGYEFVRWESDADGVVWDASAPETVVTMPGEDVKVTAVFALRGGALPSNPGENGDSTPKRTSFPWGLFIAFFILSGIAIALIVIRERFNLSYRYLFRKWIRFRAGAAEPPEGARQPEAPEEREKTKDPE